MKKDSYNWRYLCYCSRSFQNLCTGKNELILWGRNREMLDVISQDLQVRGAKNSIISHDLNDFSIHRIQN